MDSTPPPIKIPKKAQREHQRLLDQIATIGFALPGTLHQRYTRCSSHGCRCHTDPPQPHGPYPTWTRKIAKKTVTQPLTPEQAERYKPWFDNARKLRDLTTQIETLALTTAQNAEHWPPK